MRGGVNRVNPEFSRKAPPQFSCIQKTLALGTVAAVAYSRMQKENRYKARLNALISAPEGTLPRPANTAYTTLRQIVQWLPQGRRPYSSPPLPVPIPAGSQDFRIDPFYSSPHNRFLLGHAYIVGQDYGMFGNMFWGSTDVT